MNINTKNVDRNLIVTIVGEIDHHSAEAIRLKIEKDFKRFNSKNIIFDFKDVTFMDSSGIGMVIGRYKTIVKQGGQVAISDINDDCKRIFDISGLHKIINIYKSLDEALNALT